MKSVEQIKTLDGTKITTISLGTMSRNAGEKIQKRIDGMTYMSFKVLVAPIGGECEITVQSTFNASKDEILGMFLYLIATELANIL